MGPVTLKPREIMKSIAYTATFGVLIAMTGCASIVNGQNQPVSVDTRQKSAAFVGANCKLSNDKGTWFVTTPGSATIHRSAGDLAIRCEKDGHEPGLATFKSTTKGMAFGNILFGGIIGAGVDISTGAAFDYPSLLTVEMGDVASLAPVVAPPAAVPAAAAASSAAAEPAPKVAAN